MRYDYLIQRVCEFQPTVILEVGVWDGSRAEAMLEVCPDAEYIGFDLFEDGDKETDKLEFNAKTLSNSMAYIWRYSNRLTRRRLTSDQQEITQIN